MYCWRSPSMAVDAMARSLLVVLPIAETTTTGARSRRAWTMPATRSIAAADPTEVPPNFMTIMRRPRGVRSPQRRRDAKKAIVEPQRYGEAEEGRSKSEPEGTEAAEGAGKTVQTGWGSSVEHPFRMHQLGIQHGGSGGAADGVVAQSDELVIENGAGAEAADEGRHAALALGIAARLRAVVFAHIDDGPRGRAGEMAFLRHAAEAVISGMQLGHGRLSGKLYRDGNRMTVNDRDAVAVRAHHGRERLDVVAPKFAQNFLRFLLHFFLLPADVRDDIGDDIHGGNTRIAGAGDGLKSGGDDFCDTELLQRSKTHGEGDGGAVRVGDDLALPAAGALLAGNEL